MNRDPGVVPGPAVGQAPAPVEKARARTMSAWVLLNASLVCKVAANLWIVRISLDYLGAEQYAVWVTMQSIVAYLLASEIGLGQTVMNWTGDAYARGQHDRVNDVLTTGFGFYWAIVAFVWVVFTIVTFVAPVQTMLFGTNPVPLGVPLRLCLWLLGTLTLARLPLVAFSAGLAGLRELPARQWQEIASQVGLAAGTYVVLRAGGQLLSLVVGVGATLLAVGAAGYAVVKRRHPWVTIEAHHWHPAMLRPMFADSIFFFLSTVALMVQRSAGSLLTAHYATLADVPVVFAVFLVIRVLGVSVADGVSRVLQPYVIMFWGRGERSRVRFFGALSTKITFTVAVLFSTVLWLFGKEMLELWLGRGHVVDEWLLGLLLVAFVLDMLFLPATNFIWVIGRHRQLAMVMGFYAVATVCLGAIGMWWFDRLPVVGMAAGFVAACVLGQVLPMPGTIVRAIEVDRGEYLRQWLARPLALLGPVLACLFLSRLAGVADIPGRVGVGLVTFLAIGVVGWLVLFDAAERGWLRATAAQLGATARTAVRLA